MCSLSDSSFVGANLTAVVLPPGAVVQELTGGVLLLLSQISSACVFGVASGYLCSDSERLQAPPARSFSCSERERERELIRVHLLTLLFTTAVLICRVTQLFVGASTVTNSSDSTLVLKCIGETTPTKHWCHSRSVVAVC